MGKMARCKYCGAEYYSESDRCFACGQKEEAKTEHPSEPVRRWWLLVLGACTVVIGAALCIFAANEALASDQVTYWPPRQVDWAGLSVFGLFVMCVGIGITTYSLLAVDYPLWAIRKGAEPSEVRSVALVSAGLSALAFEVGYVLAALAFAITVSWEIPSLLLAWTFVAITAGVSRSPPLLFRHDGDELRPRGNRRLWGWCVVVIGLVLELFPPLLSGDQGTLIPFFTIVLGITVIVTGMGIMFGPMGRPWIPGSGTPRT